MEVLRNGKFSLPITGNQLHGLRNTSRNARNKHKLVDLTGAVGRDQVISVLEEFNILNHQLTNLEFPYPQLFALSELIIICTDTSIYEYKNGVVTLKFTTSSYHPWRLADFHEFLYLSNGAEAVKRDAYTQTYSVITSEEVPAANAICNYNGQVLINPNVVNGILFFTQTYGCSGSPWSVIDPSISTDEYSQVIKLNFMSMSELLRYGTHGSVAYFDTSASAQDKLENVYEITADSNYIYVGDISNNRIIKRSGNDLSYITMEYDFAVNSLHTSDSIEYLIDAGSYVYRRDKDTLARVDYHRNEILSVKDIASDENYIYFADAEASRISWFSKDALTYQGSFGHDKRWGDRINHIAYYNGFIYIAEDRFKRIVKVNASTYEIISMVGSLTYDNYPDDYYMEMRDMYADADYIYCCDEGGVHIHNLSDLTFNRFITLPDSGNGYGVVSVGSYIYIIDGYNSKLLKYNKSTFTFIDSIDYDEYDDDLYGLCTDGSYLYFCAYTAGDNRVYKIDIATFTEDSFYNDIASHFGSSDDCCVDGTYVYVSNQDNGYHRIDKATMSYVDEIDLSLPRTYQGIVNGTTMYLTTAVNGYTDSCVHTIDLTSNTVIDESPALYQGDSNFIMAPNFIAVNSTYIFTANPYYHYDDTLVKVFNKSDKSYVTAIDIGESINGLTANDNFLFIHKAYSDGNSTLIKKSASLPFTTIADLPTYFGSAITLINI